MPGRDGERECSKRTVTLSDDSQQPALGVTQFIGDA